MDLQSINNAVPMATHELVQPPIINLSAEHVAYPPRISQPRPLAQQGFKLGIAPTQGPMDMHQTPH